MSEPIRVVLVDDDPMVRTGLGLILATPVDEPDHRHDEARRRLDDLTDRELEVAHAIGRGLSNGELAAQLSMSVATVKAHVGRIFTQLAVDNRVQIAILVHDAQD